jgi:hypothetical protein
VRNKPFCRPNLGTATTITWLPTNKLQLFRMPRYVCLASRLACGTAWRCIPSRSSSKDRWGLSLNRIRSPANCLSFSASYHAHAHAVTERSKATRALRRVGTLRLKLLKTLTHGHLSVIQAAYKFSLGGLCHYLFRLRMQRRKYPSQLVGLTSGLEGS